MRTITRVLPAIGLFFLSPLIAEFLLGDFPLTMLWLLLILAPVYGGGAILIREIVRGTGRGWPTMMTLALAYGILEEAFTTQSLFNPNYLGLNLHLLRPAYMSMLGISAWWTIFVLTLHTVWSISVPIALMEALVPSRATKPWLGWVGRSAVAVLFVLFCIAMTKNAIKTDPVHFMATRAQFVYSTVAFVVVAVLAFFMPRIRSSRAGAPPRALVTGACALAAGSAFLLIPPTWGWRAVALYLVLDVIMISAAVIWARREGWMLQHALSLAGGAALAYAWHAFIGKPVAGHASLLVIRAGDVLLALGTIALLAIAARRTAAQSAQARLELASK